MRTNFSPKAWLYPQPVLIVAAYDENGVPCAMTAAWGCTCDYDKVLIVLGDDHKTTANILGRKAFTVSPGTAPQAVPCDYVGLVSGNKVPDKFARAGFHATKSACVDAPIIDELPMTLECELISYDTETGFCIGKIVNISADECVLTNGKIDPAKLQPITLDSVNNGYLVLGERVANAFSDGLKLE